VSYDVKRPNLWLGAILVSEKPASGPLLTVAELVRQRFVYPGCMMVSLDTLGDVAVPYGLGLASFLAEVAEVESKHRCRKERRPS
jgi:hypothetical protein